MKTTCSAKCNHPGCGEWTRFEYNTRRDSREPRAIENRSKWLCSQHSRLEDRITMTSTAKTKRLVCKKSGKGSDRLYWDGMFGLLHGPGFKVFAEDFPEGTILEVTARVILP